MPGARIIVFKGMAPRYASVRSKLGIAKVARDVDLSRGSIEPFRKPKLLKVAAQAVKAMHRIEDCCVITDDCAHVWFADTTPDCRMVIKSERGKPPVWGSGDMACAGSWVPLGIPVPEGSPTVPLLNAPSRTAAARSYIAAFEDVFGNVGAGSFPSQVITVESGQQVSVTTIPQPPVNAGVAAVRLYRSIRPWVDEGTDAAVDGAPAARATDRTTHFALVAVLPVGVTSYSDTVTDSDLGETFVSDEYSPPPQGLQQILIMESGAAVGFVGREIWFSDPFTYHGWPEKHRLILDDNVRAIAVNRDWVYVATDGLPYSIQELPNTGPRSGKAEDMMDVHTGNRLVHRHQQALPCLSPRSLSAWQEGAVYASYAGLVMLNEKGLSVMSGPWFNERSWQETWPHTGIGCGWRSHFVFATQKGTWLFSLLPTNSAIEEANLTTLSIRPTALLATRKGNLLFGDGNNVMQFDAADEYGPYLWEHDPMTMPALTSMSAGKAVGDYLGREVQFTYDVDGKRKMTRPLKAEKPFRLPRSTGLSIGLSVSGIVRITEIHVATSVADLSGVSSE